MTTLTTGSAPRDPHPATQDRDRASDKDSAMAQASGLCLAALALAAAAASPAAVAAPRRHVRWYMASGALADIELNDAFLSVPERRAAITGAYACCNFFMMHGTTGAPIGDVDGNYSSRFSPFRRHNLTVHAHGMANEAAIKSGAALQNVGQLAAFVANNGIDGVLVDYEPLDASQQHAEAYARYLSAAVAAVHAIPVPPGAPRKELGLNIADWTVLGPSFWQLYNATGIDLMASMTPTYSYIYSAWPYTTSLAKAFPGKDLRKLDIGVASALQESGAPGGRCSLKPFNTSTKPAAGVTCNSSVKNPVTGRWPGCGWNAAALTNLLDFASDQVRARGPRWLPSAHSLSAEVSAPLFGQSGTFCYLSCLLCIP
eukprot:SAG22_NODE_673_length_7973_cov_3.643129_3_plen_372_part_00